MSSGVLGRDEDVAVVSTDRRGPLLRVLACVLTHGRRQRLVHVREGMIRQVDKLVLRGGALSRLLGDPVGDGLPVAAGAGAAQDDRDLQVGHGDPFVGDQVVRTGLRSA
jgi:hypothetical protein